jgi:hypothetical protein
MSGKSHEPIDGAQLTRKCITGLIQIDVRTLKEQSGTNCITYEICVCKEVYSSWGWSGSLIFMEEYWENLESLGTIDAPL